MGNKPIKIGLQLEKTTYQAGDTISGKVFLSANQIDKDVSGVHLQLLGVEHVEIREKNNNEDYYSRGRTHRSTHTIIKSEYPLVNGVVQSGDYEYKFNWKIPPELPGSMHCNSHQSDKPRSFCEISYTLTAYVANNNSFTVPDNLERRSTVALRIIQAPPPPAIAAFNHRQLPLFMDTDVFPITEYCIWDRGSIHLGFQVDKPTTTASPGETVQVICWGQNRSRLDIDYISAKVVETVTWKTTQNSNNTHSHHTDTTNRTLIEERLSVQAYEQWQPIRNKTYYDRAVNNDSLINNNNNNEQGSLMLTFNLTLPNDTRDTHTGGQLIQVRHVLVVTAVVTVGGGAFSTISSPEMACAIQVVPSSNNNVGGLILDNVVSDAAAREEEYDDPNYQHHLVEAQALPEDWHPIEVGVISLPQASVILLDEEPVHHSSPPPTGGSIFTSTTTVASSAPDESLLLDDSNCADRGSSSFSFTPKLEHLQTLAVEDPTVIPVVLEDPGWKALVQSLSPRDYCSLVVKAAASDNSLLQQQQPQEHEQTTTTTTTADPSVVVARALAMHMGNHHFQCRHILACLWALPNEANRIKVLCEIAPLASDLLAENNRAMIEQELNSVELSSFRATLHNSGSSV